MMIRHNNASEIKKLCLGKYEVKTLRKIVLIITEKKFRLFLHTKKKAKNRRAAKQKNQFKKLSFNAVHSF